VVQPSIPKSLGKEKKNKGARIKQNKSDKWVFHALKSASKGRSTMTAQEQHRDSSTLLGVDTKAVTN
jgi:hypothetical protein